MWLFLHCSKNCNKTQNAEMSACVYAYENILIAKDTTPQKALNDSFY
jgi:hypothetical protein